MLIAFWILLMSSRLPSTCRLSKICRISLYFMKVLIIKIFLGFWYFYIVSNSLWNRRMWFRCLIVSLNLFRVLFLGWLLLRMLWRSRNRMSYCSLLIKGIGKNWTIEEFSILDFSSNMGEIKSTKIKIRGNCLISSILCLKN